MYTLVRGLSYSVPPSLPQFLCIHYPTILSILPLMRNPEATCKKASCSFVNVNLQRPNSRFLNYIKFLYTLSINGSHYNIVSIWHSIIIVMMIDLLDRLLLASISQNGTSFILMDTCISMLYPSLWLIVIQDPWYET
jgi:hypothetical protein